MTAFPQTILLAATPQALQAADALLGATCPPALLDWLKRSKTPAQAEANLAQLEPLPECVAVPMAEALPALAAWAKTSEGTQFVWLLEAPDRSLAQQLPPAAGADAWMQAWTARHREVLRALQRLRARSRAFDVDEWLAAPALLAERLGLALRPGSPAVPAPDALARCVAQAALQPQAALRALAAELFDACEPLGSVAAPGAELLSAWQALQGERALLTQQVAAQSTQGQGLRDALQASSDRLDTQQRELEQLQTHLNQAQAERDALQQTLEAAQAAWGEQRQALGAQQDALQAERDTLQHTLDAAQAAWGEQRQALGAQQDALQAERDALQQTLEAARSAWNEQGSHQQARIVALEEDLGAAQLSLDALQAERDSLQQSLDAARIAWEQERSRQQQAQALVQQDLELVTAQLRQLQREVLPAQAQRLQQESARAQQLLIDLHATQDALHDANDVAEAALRRQGRDLDLPDALIDRCEIEARREDAPHRELHLRLLGLRLGPQRLEQAGLRLLEHLGHEGLALYGGAGETPLLSAWQPQLSEGERELMVLLPDDEAGRQRLDALGRADWERLLALVAGLQLALHHAPMLADSRWPALADRLQQRLQEWPSRLRYDAQQRPPLDEGGGELRLDQVLFAGRRWPGLRLRWQQGRLALQAEGGLALSAWPRDADCNPLPWAELPIGRLAAPGLAGLDATDRALVQALLDTLGGEEPPLPGMDVATLAALRRDWQLRCAPPAGRLRRLLRRLRGAGGR